MNNRAQFRPALRPGTTDAAIWQDVFVDNVYGLGRFDEAEVILDVGAHIGAFSGACLVRGARRILAFEPDPESYSLAQLNLRRLTEGLALEVTPELYGCAVWRSDRAEEVFLSRTRPSLFSKLPHPAANATLFCEEGSVRVPAVGLDAVLTQFERVALVKLDCEGAEWPILLTARQLRRVSALIVEVHSLHWKGLECGREAGPSLLRQFGRLGVDVLVAYLAGFGLRCTKRDLQSNLFGNARYYYGQMRFEAARPEPGA